MRPDPRVQAVPPFLHHLARSIEDINMLALIILTKHQQWNADQNPSQKKEI